jgi:hypothetical protein
LHEDRVKVYGREVSRRERRAGTSRIEQKAAKKTKELQSRRGIQVDAGMCHIKLFTWQDVAGVSSKTRQAKQKLAKRTKEMRQNPRKSSLLDHPFSGALPFSS